MPFSAVWSGSTLFAILSIMIGVYTICHSLHSDQGLHYLPLSAFWSESTLFAIISSLINVCTVILSSLIRVFIICHSQQSDQVQAQLSFSGTVLNRLYTICHSLQSDQGLHCLLYSTVWSESILFVILSSLIQVYTVILSSLLSVYTICHSQHSFQSPHY